ncbi:MAG: bifunctional 3,4-dihydroxy-2-butanone-4-phosphate synthase/GTP cyclohydrolase II [Phycisphaerae bacterium]|nr:bifunctional 3,4-dihydroxy-2-butanone-4-phosphate synthase/GTP cyclohydrolase II [Phycisphaerae bacterium]
MNSIEDILDDLKQGKMIVLVDDESRENEGDLVALADKTTPEMVNFMATHGRGLICLPMTNEKANSLGLHPQAADNTSQYSTAFTVTIDAAEGITTGISAADRALTIQLATRDDAKPADFARPGHIFPLRAVDGGTLLRVGQTEGGVDLAKLAGAAPLAVICEIMKEDGTMARRDDLDKFCTEHDLKMCSVANIVQHRLKSENLIKREVEIDLPTAAGVFRAIAYTSLVDEHPHVALCYGGVGQHDADGNQIVHDEPVLVRVHSECLTGDVFASLRCDCGDQLHAAMREVVAAGKGAVVYMRQEGRGIGLINKLRAYKLQIEEGMDTVEANLHLGFQPDQRDYGVGNQILRDLGLRKLRLMTNNPRKVFGLGGFGLEIVERVPVQIAAGEHSKDYLTTKKNKLGHMLDDL